MFATAPAIPGAEAADQAARDWQTVHADGSIQYGPLPPMELPQRADPEWLRWLARIFEPIARALGTSWPVLKWCLLAVAVMVALYVLWRLTEPLRERLSPERTAAADPGWSPDRAAALALLEDADRLAAEGRFDEATHLLLQRSVGQIASARPDWVHPASTAREIAALPALPGPARQAFAVIAGRVERSLFALTALGPADWQAARAAYADFALQNLPRAQAS